MLKLPPRDSKGGILPHDHEQIGDPDGIIRRVSAQQMVADAEGKQRPSTMAFSPSSGLNSGMSVDIENLILNSGLNPQEFVTTPRWIASVKFFAGELRSLGLKVGYDPLPDNPFHGEVWGNFNKSTKRALLESCRWYVEPK